MEIRLLSEDLRNKISAGEVVARPASVVKELVENSLDAESTEISIVVNGGGHNLIQVTDNGLGIEPDYLPAAFQRYSTSKISKLDDLISIQTLGFRGEALASIASVSEVSVLSSTAGGEGGELYIKQGDISQVKPAPALPGTQVTVKNLFYNTPARKKFLKSPRIEFRKIVEMVRRYALAFPEVSLKLISDNREIFNLHPESLRERIAAVMDPGYQDQLLPVNFSKGEYSITGFTGNLNLLRNRPGEQYIFLNRRFIQNRLLNSGVYQAYRSIIKRGEYPYFVLNLVVPGSQVDVNVHPFKTEVRFKDEWRIFHVLKSSLEEALSSILDTIPDLEKPAFDLPFNIGSRGNSFVRDWNQLDENQAKISFESQNKSEDRIKDLNRAKSYASNLAARGSSLDSVLSGDNIWQVHTKYIVSQIDSGLVIIDQHVAHERVLFEEALKALDSKPLQAQTLLFPEVMEFAADTFSVLLDVLPDLEKIGFRMREFGKNTVMVEAIPAEMGWGNEKQIIREILDNYLEHRSQYTSGQEAVAASFACKAAVKAGDVLTKQEMQALVNRLFGTKHPYYCPHGRPIIVQLSIEELDRRFERI